MENKLQGEADRSYRMISSCIGQSFGNKLKKNAVKSSSVVSFYFPIGAEQTRYAFKFRRSQT